MTDSVVPAEGGASAREGAREAAGARKGEVRRLLRLSLPAAGTQLSVMALGVVDTAMVGRVSVEALAASALANAWLFAVLMFGNGVVLGLDPIVAQAHGAGDRARLGRALQHGIVWSLIVSAPACIAIGLTEAVLVALGQDAALAERAGAYAIVQLPSVPFFFLYAALRQYLQGREIVRPALCVILAANVVNVLANAIFIFGGLGVPALGLLGAGIATSVTRVFSFAGLLAWVWRARLYRGAWVPWSRAALDPVALRELLGYGWPVAVHISLEMGMFSAAALLAGGLGEVSVAAHTAALQLAALAFMPPLGVSMAACTRVGNLIGACEHAAAQRAARLSLGIAVIVMAFSAAIFLGLRDALPRIFTGDPQVVALASSVLVIAAAFQVADGLQVVGCGILRGMGRVRPVLAVNLLSYWAVGIPLGAWLAYRAGWALEGLWWGLCAGLTLAALALVIWVELRGPATLGAERR